MFSKTAAILLIMLFIVSQYGKQAAYLQCKIENLNNNSKIPVCDCEKSQSADLAKNDAVPASKTHVHPSIDEYYVLNLQDFYFDNNSAPVKFINHHFQILPSFGNSLFRPPQC